MNKSITQATQNDKQISIPIKRFFTRFHISSALKAVYGKGNPMITGHLGSSFYTFLTKCLISHGYRLFKYCFKCSEQCFQITLNFQTKKINELANAFMDALPTIMKIRLQAA